MASSEADTANNNNNNNGITKKRKIEIKKVEEIKNRLVTFSKRKLGLYNKLTEISLLCQVETALIITSQNSKLFTCGYPNADAVVRRYITGGSRQRLDSASKKKQHEMIETLTLEYEASHNHLKEEKKRLKDITETQQKNSFCFHPWWNLSTEGMSLENLEQFKNSLERFRSNLVAALQGKQLNNSASSIPPITSIFPTTQSAMVLPPMLHTIFPSSQTCRCWLTISVEIKFKNIATMVLVLLHFLQVGLATIVSAFKFQFMLLFL